MSTPSEKSEMLMTAATLILKALDDDPEREGLVETPRRFRDMFLEDFSMNGTPEAALEEMIIREETFDQMIMVRDVPIRGICEHHLLPWIGTVCIAYLPQDSAVGLSKVTRMVEAAARGLSVQERVGEKLADAMEAVLEPLGVMVVIEARHMCTQIRGVRAERQKFTTSIARGAFLENPSARMEFLTLYGKE